MEFISKNIFLVLAALVSGGMLIWPFLRRGTGGPWVNTLEATQLINRSDALVIDLRTAEEYAKGHILGAKNIPLADLERRKGELEKHKKTKPVIVHCATGNSAGGGVALLRKNGFDSVHNLAGGYAAWQAAGLPVQK